MLSLSTIRVGLSPFQGRRRLIIDFFFLMLFKMQMQFLSQTSFKSLEAFNCQVWQQCSVCGGRRKKYTVGITVVFVMSFRVSGQRGA